MYYFDKDGILIKKIDKEYFEFIFKSDEPNFKFHLTHKRKINKFSCKKFSDLNIGASNPYLIACLNVIKGNFYDELLASIDN